MPQSLASPRIAATPLPPLNPPPADPRIARSGLIYGLAAYTWWGLSPLYFKLLPGVPALVILCHRFVWSVLLLAVLITAFRRWPQVRATLADSRLLRWLLLTAALITCNWLVFIYAIETHRLVDASLGYFINPLFTVVLGMVFLGERLTGARWAAVALALGGLVYLAVAQGSGLPWIAVSLPVTFGFYSLIRKRTPVDPITGLFVETAFLSPLALAYLAWAHTRPEAAGTPLNAAGTLAILSLAGAVTTAPLIWFVAAARRLPMVTLGFLQFLNPTLQFLTAVVLFGEPFAGAKLVAFALIWIAVAVFVADLAWRANRARRA
ncbi:MAG: EamA family transporter RarD [Phycisphaerales bacterium]|nr:EamA family transporter RarD [Phycisphaerales bacterium]